MIAVGTELLRPDVAAPALVLVPLSTPGTLYGFPFSAAADAAWISSRVLE